MTAVTRTQFRNALYDLMVAQKADTPTLLRQAHRYRPGSVSDPPVGWVGQIIERLTYDAGTRSRTITAEVLIARGFPTDNVTDADPFDQLIDALVERLTAASSVIPNTILQLDTVDDGEIEFGGPEATAVYRGVTLGISLRIWEGRR